MDFLKRVRIVCQHIPYGKVATYGQIALLCQRPMNSRQVGRVIRQREMGEIPAHRILNAQGFLSGAGAFTGKFSQKELLEQEGVKVNGELKVDLKKYIWKTTMDEALFFEAEFERGDC